VTEGRLLEWDSEFWGVLIAQLASVDSGAWAKEHGVACAYLLVPAEDSEQAHRAEASGYQLMDLRVELEAPAMAAPAPVRPHRESDIDRLRALARTNHRDTRFYADPGFPVDGCDDLYDTWIRRSCEGWADVVLVAESDGAPVGYVSVHGREGHGSIGLIGVEAGVRGRGFGEALVRGALDWCVRNGLPECRVVTQGRNIAAQRVFQRCGFRTRSVDLWFHKWFDQ
jgi:dTDP-4-amino-4,6-dideoxy-D-galactose acyltransferase